MKIALSLITSAALLFTTSVASIAELNKPVTKGEIASKYCAAEWARLVELETDAKLKWWSSQIEIYPEIDTAAIDAYSKFDAAHLALHNYFSTFAKIVDGKNQNPEFLNLARARFDLSTCLTPTEAERDLVEDLVRTKTVYPYTANFASFDVFECMQIFKASEVIFNTEPGAIDFDAFRSAHIKICE